MNKTVINITILLALATVAYAGYYFYASSAAGVTEDASQSLADMQAKAQIFVGHRRILDTVNMDVALFDDDRFRTLRDQSEPLREYGVGRSNPFADVSAF